MKAAYDQKDPKSIEAYGQRLLDGTLRSVQGINPVPSTLLDTKVGGRTRGAFGSALETYYYDIHPGNESEPDFKEAGVELKTSPIKRLVRGGYSAKERLVFSIINYQKEAGKTFQTSSFLHKSANVMWVSYLREEGQMLGDQLVKIAKLIRFDDLPKKDKKIIQDDWETIVAKIRAGKAHELSEGDTLYLAACTKGVNGKSLRTQHDTDLMAKPRAFSFKSGYMTALIRRQLDLIDVDEEAIVKDSQQLENKSFEELVLSRLDVFVGKTVEEIAADIAPDLSTKAKGYHAALGRRMFGVKKQKVEELENAEVVLKAVRISEEGMPAEAISFPYFKYKELIKERWNDSTLKEKLSKRFLFLIYQYDDGDKGVLRFKGGRFWTMPVNELDGVVARMWRRTIKGVAQSDLTNLPKESDHKIIHIRPHGRDGLDTDELPDGSYSPKKCFWLNKDYIKGVLEME